MRDVSRKIIDNQTVTDTGSVSSGWINWHWSAGDTIYQVPTNESGSIDITTSIYFSPIKDKSLLPDIPTDGVNRVVHGPAVELFTVTAESMEHVNYDDVADLAKQAEYACIVVAGGEQATQSTPITVWAVQREGLG